MINYVVTIRQRIKDIYIYICISVKFRLHAVSKKRKGTISMSPNMTKVLQFSINVSEQILIKLASFYICYSVIWGNLRKYLNASF